MWTEERRHSLRRNDLARRESGSQEASKYWFVKSLLERCGCIMQFPLRDDCNSYPLGGFRYCQIASSQRPARTSLQFNKVGLAVSFQRGRNTIRTGQHLKKKVLERIYKIWTCVRYLGESSRNQVFSLDCIQRWK